MSSKFLISIAILLAALVSGCVSVPMASPEQDAAARSFAVRPGKANIYVYRNEIFGTALRLPVALDGKLVGDTAINTFLVLEVSPGSHTIQSKTENGATVTINAVAGQSYYVWQEVKMGARAALHHVDEATGRAAVNECKLVASL